MGALVSFATFSDELVKLSKSTLPIPKEPATSAKVHISKADAMIYRALVKGSAVKINITEDAKHYGGGYFDPGTKEIGVAAKDFRILAHELGHVEVDKHLMGQLIQSRVARLAYMASPLFSIGAGILMAKGKTWGLLLPVAAVAPTLVSEALATHEGGKLLDMAKVKKHQREAYDNLTAKGFASYTALPVMGAVQGAIAYAIAHH